jgi:hypothetical protein
MLVVHLNLQMYLTACNFMPYWQISDIVVKIYKVAASSCIFLAKGVSYAKTHRSCFHFISSISLANKYRICYYFILLSLFLDHVWLLLGFMNQRSPFLTKCESNSSLEKPDNSLQTNLGICINLFELFEKFIDPCHNVSSMDQICKIIMSQKVM